MSARQHAARLRAIADHVGQPGLAALGRSPGVQAVYRVTIYYFDRRACHVLGTLTKAPLASEQLVIHFEGALGHKPLTYPMTAERMEAFVRALATIDFDHLPDQPNLPTYATSDLWFIERAAGVFSHSLIVAPALAEGVYTALVDAVREYLPEILREIPP
ncbi:MAG: hypothetical protein IH587_05685 [Anaerolineae bacterium]|nr:hypothetical protein [Anaerolineae bacterium]